MSRLEQDWPAYVLMAGVAVFIVSVFIHAKRLEREERKKREQDKSKQINKEKG